MIRRVKQGEQEILLGRYPVPCQLEEESVIDEFDAPEIYRTAAIDSHGILERCAIKRPMFKTTAQLRNGTPPK